MTYLDINNLVSREILPEINNTIEEYLEDKFSYIENEEDLEDLEDAEVDEELINEVKSKITVIIKDVKDDYDLSSVNEPIKDEELYSIIESSFNDYRDIMIERYNEKFEREEYLDEYYSDTDLF